jgi:hypothetical protein
LFLTVIVPSLEMGLGQIVLLESVLTLSALCKIDCVSIVLLLTFRVSIDHHAHVLSLLGSLRRLQFKVYFF